MTETSTGQNDQGPAERVPADPGPAPDDAGQSAQGPTCAVWYIRYGHAGVETCDDEEDAAVQAVSMQDDNFATVQGVQYADGRFVPLDDWAAYRDERDRRFAAWSERRRLAESVAPPGTRDVKVPWEPPPDAPASQTTATVLFDEPDWLGAP